MAAGTANNSHQPVAVAETAVKDTPAPNKTRIIYPKNRAPILELSDGQKKPIYSLLNVRRQMKFGEYVWDDSGIADGKIWIKVDLARQTLSIFRAGHEIGTAVILYGAYIKPTPPGVFPILAKAKKHRSNLYDAEMPFMLRLSWDGIAIHASDVRVGGATHGCIGVPPAFAELLFNAVKVGDQVSITAA